MQLLREIDRELLGSLRLGDRAVLVEDERLEVGEARVGRRVQVVGPRVPMNKLHREDKPAEGKLAGYLALIGYEVPHGGRARQVGDTVRALRPPLQAGRRLTARQRERWLDLLEHNRNDCAGMRAVCLRATREIESAGTAPREAKSRSTGRGEASPIPQLTGASRSDRR